MALNEDGSEKKANAPKGGAKAGKACVGPRPATAPEL